MLRKRKFDVILESGSPCRTWIAGEAVRIGDFVTGTKMSIAGIVSIEGIVKEIIAINGVKQKTSNKENADERS